MYLFLPTFLFSAKENEKAIKTLQNPKAPLIKKRQLMRTKLGDYRSKMEADEKSLKLADPKFTARKRLGGGGGVGEAKVLKKRVVLTSAGAKTAVSALSKCDKSTIMTQPPDKTQSSSGGFKFNFNLERSEAATKPKSKEPESKRQQITSGPYNSFHFQKSDNSFKFNFSGT